MSATLPLTLVQSVKLLTNGWRVVVQNPNGFNVAVQARVSCVRVISGSANAQRVRDGDPPRFS